MKQKIDHTLDFRGAIRSMTLLELTNLFREMENSQTLEVLVQDPDLITDILHVLPASAYKLSDMRDDKDVYKIRIKKIKGGDTYV
ncbi:MAG: sulfurtransferase TusA family protein [Desulfobacterales bacterium]|nr:sulfurtransferase TusA family protein [Desulfobacterales bacterium]